MANETRIGWTDLSWNPVSGCSKVSPGCAHCYAAELSLRYGQTSKPWTPANAAENVVLKPHKLREPLSVRGLAAGVPGGEIVNAQRASEQRLRLASIRREERRAAKAAEARKRLERSSRLRLAPTPYEPTPMVAECWFAAHLPEPGPCSGGLVRCHLIDQQVLRRAFPHGYEGRALAVLQADARAWVWGCGGDSGLGGHHGRLDFAAINSKRLVIPRAKLPEGVEAMAEELGLLWWLDRCYGSAA